MKYTKVACRRNTAADREGKIFSTFIPTTIPGPSFHGRSVVCKLKLLSRLAEELCFSRAVCDASVIDVLHSTADKREMQYQSIRITSLLIKLDDQWLSSQHQLVNAYKQIWCEDQYQVHSIVKSGGGAAVDQIPSSVPG